MIKKITRVFVISVVLIFTFSTIYLYSQSGQNKSVSITFPAVDPESVGISEEQLKVITDRINEWQENSDIIGAEILIIKSRKTVLHETFGWKNREKKIAWEKNTICRIRSMTKPYVGTSILMLIEEGKLALSDKVSKYVTSYRNKKSPDITIEQLLYHTGGFRQPGYPGAAFNYDSLEELVKTIGDSGPTYSPGERYSYSDAGSSTLAYIVTLVSGMPVEDFIQTRIFNPLGMQDSFCNLAEDDLRRSRVSCTYMKSASSFRKYWDNSSPQRVPFFRGSGGIYSTVTDYARFLSMWMDHGKAQTIQFLKPSTVEIALISSLQSSNNNYSMEGYGYQWQIFDKSKKPLPVFGHGGSDGTNAIAYPDEDLMVLYFTQSRGNRTTGKIRSIVEDALDIQ